MFGMPPNGQEGASLVEMMIAVALLTVIGSATGSFFQRMNTAEIEARARQTASSEVDVWLASIERDLQRRTKPSGSAPTPALCQGGNECKAFQFTRLAKRSSSDFDGNYTSRYETACVEIPGKIKSRFEQGGALDFTSAGLSSKFGSNHRYKCMASVNCPRGRYPQIKRTLTGTGGLIMPNYPAPLLPDLKDNKGAATSMIAAAICSDTNAGIAADRIVIEYGVLAEEGHSLKVDRREVSVARSNLAKIQILPNERD